jgi:hypothetical protein
LRVKARGQRDLIAVVGHAAPDARLAEGDANVSTPPVCGLDMRHLTINPCPDDPTDRYEPVLITLGHSDEQGDVAGRPRPISRQAAV